MTTFLSCTQSTQEANEQTWFLCNAYIHNFYAYDKLVDDEVREIRVLAEEYNLGDFYLPISDGISTQVKAVEDSLISYMDDIPIFNSSNEAFTKRAWKETDVVYEQMIKKGKASNVVQLCYDMHEFALNDIVKQCRTYQTTKGINDTLMTELISNYQEYIRAAIPFDTSRLAQDLSFEGKNGLEAHTLLFRTRMNIKVLQYAILRAIREMMYDLHRIDLGYYTNKAERWLNAFVEQDTSIAAKDSVRLVIQPYQPLHFEVPNRCSIVVHPTSIDEFPHFIPSEPFTVTLIADEEGRLDYRFMLQPYF